MAQRIFRSDDTSAWIYKYGSGKNGNAVVSSNVNWDSSFGSNYFTFTGTSGATSGALGSAYTGITPVLIHQSQNSGIGLYELNYINNPGSSSTATLLFPLINTYVGGAQLITANQFTNITINSGVTVSVPAWNGSTGGIGFVLCDGIWQINGSFSALGAGYRGGLGGPSTNTTAFQGEGQNGVGGQVSPSSDNHNGEGGGGGRFGDGAGYAGVGIMTQADLTSLFLFGGGGGGGNSNSGAGGMGGTSGGLIFGIAKILSISNTGSLIVNGGNGIVGAGSQGPGGGAPAGAINLRVEVPKLGNNLIQAIGGFTAGGSADPGGCGESIGTTGRGNPNQQASNGRVHLDYVVAPVGSTSPIMDSRFDATLQESSPMFAFF